MSYPVSNSYASAPAQQDKGKHSLFESVCSATGKAIAMPFRLASSAVNGGIFAAYYVTAAAATGLAAAGGTVFGMVKIAADVAQGKPHKSLCDYTITAARETFNFISQAYYELPKHGPEIIFASAVIVAVTTLAIMAGADAPVGGGGGGHGGGNSGVCNSYLLIHSAHYSCPGSIHRTVDRVRPEDDYNPSGITAALHPYRPAIVLGRKIMGKSSEVLNRGQEAD